MKRCHTLLVAIALAAPLVACSDTGTPAPPAATRAPAPPAPVADASIPPPSTSGGTSTEAAARGTDSAATNPMGTMSKRQESESMPMAGQGNSHSSPSIEPAKK